MTIFENFDELQDLALICIIARRLLYFDKKIDNNFSLANTQKDIEKFLFESRFFDRCDRLWFVLCSSLHQALKNSKVDEKILRSFLKFLILSNSSNETTNQRLETYWLLRVFDNSHTIVAISTKQIIVNSIKSYLTICIFNVRDHVVDESSKSYRLSLVSTSQTFVSRLSKLNIVKAIYDSRHRELSNSYLIDKTRRKQYLNELKATQKACDAQLSLF